MLKRLVLTHDGSDLANAAVPYAAALARALDGELMILRVLDVQAGERLENRELIESSLFVLKAALEQGGARSVQLAIRQGEAGPTIVEEVQGRADLLVMATHGRGGLRRAVLGSVADYVLHHSDGFPIVLCRAGHPGVEIKRLLIPLDGSPRANEAIPIGQELALASGAGITLLRTIDSVSQVMATATPAGYDYEPALSVEAAEECVEAQRTAAAQDLDAVAEGLHAAGVPQVDSKVVEGLPGDTIVEAAARLPAELVVLATRGRGGLGRALLGSVADYVVRHAETAVVLVRSNVD